MGLLLGLAPFILFAILMRLSVDLALWIAFAAAFTIGIRAFLNTQVLRFLDAGSTALFATLALYRGFIEPGLSIPTVRLLVDIGLLAIVVASVALQQPFSLQYSSEDIVPDLLDSPAFLRANYILSGAWAFAFATMVVADASLPLTEAVAAGLVVLVGALTFTWRFPPMLSGINATVDKNK
jgi:hypothetical protein